jgi:hypothetical protein
MYCFRENSNFLFSNQKIITLVNGSMGGNSIFGGQINRHFNGNLVTIQRYLFFRVYVLVFLPLAHFIEYTAEICCILLFVYSPNHVFLYCLNPTIIYPDAEDRLACAHRICNYTSISI